MAPTSSVAETSASTSVIVNPEGVEIIARVGQARADDPARFQLTGVYLDLPAERVVATNGKVLAIGKAPQGPGSVWEGSCPTPVLLPDEAVKAIQKCFTWKIRGLNMEMANKRSTPRVWLTIEGDYPSRTITLNAIDSQQSWREADGCYPDYGCCLPGAKDQPLDRHTRRVQRINPEYLLLAWKVVLGEIPTTLDLLACKPQSPAWLVNSADRVAMAIMPFVLNADESGEKEAQLQAELSEFFGG